ncbi:MULTISPECIES: spore coat protein [unclassified Sedimentibacter]|uniref:spore coat protein n=1 Tax=unclassified Sedimentibacter TaxID=2649220 RepID=UPI0027E108A5|nr:spore coat protein [Sedimentibacter sp. MB35-C1]WMJ77403.1 spore coat protein [Sedimentibacter sp. MB35-C1]
MNFTQKERTLLEDQKSHEEICIQKYTNYASLAQDQELKNIFNQIAQTEQQHYNTIDQLLKGQVPQMQQGGSQQNQSSGMQMKSQQLQSMQGSQQKQANQSPSFVPKGQSLNYSNSDKDLCSDLLMTEKYVSSTYDTAIFEFRDPQVRSILNHIQKEEQQHGETLYKYMESKGMYQAK